MIVINNKEDCCGCSACQSVCGVRAILMYEDSEGFKYPKVDMELCMECGQCEEVCPVLKPYDKISDYEVYAARNLDGELREASSSGGLFSALAERVLASGGVVFGAAFDERNNLKHKFVEDVEDLDQLRRSKYLQSDMGDVFCQVRDFLLSDREVLFCGTSCQVAGLSHFLGREYPKLLKVDIVCHSAPSPKVFREYLKELFGNQKIETINFRDKSQGWLNYSLTLTHDSEPFSLCFRENPYMRGFLKGLFTRPSCYRCPAKSLSSGSDMTLGDFWGVEKFHSTMADNRGTSLIIVLTSRGMEAFAAISDKIYCEESTMERAVVGNPRIMSSASKNPKRDRFFALFGKVALVELIISLSNESRYKKIMRRIRRAIKILKWK